MPPASGSKLLRVRNSTLLVTDVSGGFPEQGLSQHMAWAKSNSAGSFSSTSPENFNFSGVRAQPEQNWV